MNHLIDQNGQIRFGLYDEPVGTVNFADYRLETPMGLKVPRLLKRFWVNQFVFCGISGPEIMAGIAVVDLKYLHNGFFYCLETRDQDLHEAKRLTPPVSGFIKPVPETPEAGFKSRGLKIGLNAGRLQVTGSGMELDVNLNLDAARPLRLCTRAGYRGWVYTQKTAPIPLTGQLRVGAKTYDLSDPAYLGVLDWTCGYMRRETFWNWAAAAWRLDDGRRLGLNLSCGVNETSHTENAFWLNDRLTKIDTVEFGFNPKDLSAPWRICSADGKVDLHFSPQAQRSEHVNAVAVASRFTQLMGTFEGTLRTDSGETIAVKGCRGWTEDHYAKW